jgi:D-glycero-D-manno-heptose 1,7-bisphosphate phosphatase
MTKERDGAEGAVFLDRDGTINVDVDYLSTPDEVEFIPGSIDAIRQLNDLGVPVIVITNQSGIARGLLTEKDMHAVHAEMDAVLRRHGARVDDYFFCPHHPDAVIEQYRKQCTCRKPEPGMLIDAAKKHTINLHSSFMIGDKCVDMKAGKAAGAVCLQVATGYGSAERQIAEGTRDYFTDDLLGAVQIVKSIIHQRRQSHE